MNLEVVKFIIEHGADKNLKSKTTNPQTAWQYAEKHCAND